jgi:hypothetical protein
VFNFEEQLGREKSQDAEKGSFQYKGRIIKTVFVMLRSN